MGCFAGAQHDNLMAMLLPILIAAVTGYLLGSLPFGYLIARAKGVNIFEVGSKSPGATNVLRVLGKGPGYLVFILDALKGATAAGWPFVFYCLNIHDQEGRFVRGPYSEYLACAVVGLVAAILGHSFSCFLKFRGGKGVATAAGGFLVLLPVETLIAGAVWVAVFYSSRYVSFASIIAAIVLPAAAFFLHEPPFLQWFAVLIAVLVILRHRANIARILNGTENKFVKKKESPQ
jgi:glycerol-3-phosphate acyltransferase PlsY